MSRPGPRLRTLAAGLALAVGALSWGAPGVAAQDGSAQDGATPEVIPEPVPPEQVWADEAVEDETPLDPSTWIFDPEDRMSRWLDKPALDPKDLAARPEAYAEVLASHGLSLDIEGRTLALRGATIHDRTTLRYPIEYLVVTSKGKTYEACVLVQAMPSVIDACLKAMGLASGSPTLFTMKDPPPSDEELAAGALPYTMTSAGGDLLEIMVTWVDEEGRPASTSLESMLVEWPAPELDADGFPVEGAEPPEPRLLEDRGWIFCGSTYAEYRQGRDLIEWHRGDVEGDVVAIYLDGRRSCLLERNSLDGIDGSLYTLNPDTMPPAGTPVTLLVKPTGERVESRVVDLGDRVPDAVQGDPAGGR